MQYIERINQIRIALQALFVDVERNETYTRIAVNPSSITDAREKELREHWDRLITIINANPNTMNSNIQGSHLKEAEKLLDKIRDCIEQINWD